MNNTSIWHLLRMDESLSALKKHVLIMIACCCTFAMDNYKLSADSERAPPALSSLQQRPT